MYQEIKTLTPLASLSGNTEGNYPKEEKSYIQKKYFGGFYNKYQKCTTMRNG